MKKSPLVHLIVVILFAAGLAYAKDKHSPLPAGVLSARTIYVDNQTNDASLLDDAYMGLNKWGRFDLVDSPRKADLILRLSGSSYVKYVPGGDSSATYDPKPVSARLPDGEELAPPGCTRISLVVPKSGVVLWSEVRKTNSAEEQGRLLDGLHDAVDQEEKARNK
jgi:hypothetical protein